MSVDLDLAEELAGVRRASLAHATLEVPPETGQTLLLEFQLANDGRPMDALWVAREKERVVGWAVVQLPWMENRHLAFVRGQVLPSHRRRGLGSELLGEALTLSRAGGRSVGRSGAYLGTDGIGFLERHGFDTEGQKLYAVRRLDLHDAPFDLWQDLGDEAAEAARDYELVRVLGPAPAELLPSLVAVHAAINDAPSDEGREPHVFDEQRVRDFDESMVRRHQTEYRVLARHVPTGEWAGMSMLFVDESSPSVAFQEDTSVVRAHRGHRLGLLMKLDMLRWIADERPEVAATDTWNATDNHHMIAVNERLGCRVTATHVGYRRAL